jgi:hypothetical protein
VVLDLGRLAPVTTPAGLMIVPCVGAVPTPAVEKRSPPQPGAAVVEVVPLPLSALAAPQLVESAAGRDRRRRRRSWRFTTSAAIASGASRRASAATSSPVSASPGRWSRRPCGRPPDLARHQNVQSVQITSCILGESAYNSVETVKTVMRARSLHSPRQLAEALDVSESSVKRWCDQGLIETERTAGGHRRVTLPAALRFLRDSGTPLARPRLLGLVGFEAAAGDEGESHARLVTALAAGDEDAVRGTLFGLYAGGRALADLCDRELAAAFTEIGERWQHGRTGGGSPAAPQPGRLRLLRHASTTESGRSRAARSPSGDRGVAMNSRCSPLAAAILRASPCSSA